MVQALAGDWKGKERGRGAILAGGLWSLDLRQKMADLRFRLFMDALLDIKGIRSSRVVIYCTCVANECNF